MKAKQDMTLASAARCSLFGLLLFAVTVFSEGMSRAATAERLSLSTGWELRSSFLVKADV
jgi:hypothetical protein